MTVYPPGEVLTWAAILFAVICLVIASRFHVWFKLFLVALLAVPLGFTLKVILAIALRIYC
jgi:hypothetical protein